MTPTYQHSCSECQPGRLQWQVEGRPQWKEVWQRWLWTKPKVPELSCLWGLAAF